MDWEVALKLFVAPFWMLLFAHVVMDYSLQTDWIGKGKNWNFNKWLPEKQTYESGVPWYYIMAAHCIMHGGAVTILTGSVYMGLAETIIHFVADCLKCAKITNIHEDQAIHILCKVLWAGLLVATKFGV